MHNCVNLLELTGPAGAVSTARAALLTPTGDVSLAQAMPLPAGHDGSAESAAQHWGCPGDALPGARHVTEANRKGVTRLTLMFRTPGCAPIHLAEALTGRVPALTVRHHFIAQAMHGCGSVTSQDGRIVSSTYADPAEHADALYAGHQDGAVGEIYGLVNAAYRRLGQSGPLEV